MQIHFLYRVALSLALGELCLALMIALFGVAYWQDVITMAFVLAGCDVLRLTFTRQREVARDIWVVVGQTR